MERRGAWASVPKIPILIRENTSLICDHTEIKSEKRLEPLNIVFLLLNIARYYRVVPSQDLPYVL